MSTWAFSWGNSWGNSWGLMGPAAGAMTVIAYRRGWFGGNLVEVGQTLTLTTPYEYTPYWMTISSSVPTGWARYLEAYSQQTDNEIIRPLTTADILAILARRP